MNGYTRELVERLMPAVWDESCAFGMSNPLAPVQQLICRNPDCDARTVTLRRPCSCCEPAGRRAATNPKLGNTLYAHLADIKAAWKHAPLSLKHRRALLLRYGLGWREREIARHERVIQQAISQRLVEGIGVLIGYLNVSTYECDSETEGSDAA